MQLSLGVEPTQYALGRSMAFFRLGAAAALLALDDIDNDAALRQTLRDSIAAFAKRSAARKCVNRQIDRSIDRSIYVFIHQSIHPSSQPAS